MYSACLFCHARLGSNPEEIAAIADNLLLPAGIGEFIRRHRSAPPPVDSE